MPQSGQVGQTDDNGQVGLESARLRMGSVQQSCPAKLGGECSLLRHESLPARLDRQPPVLPANPCAGEAWRASALDVFGLCPRWRTKPREQSLEKRPSPGGTEAVRFYLCEVLQPPAPVSSSFQVGDILSCCRRVEAVINAFPSRKFSQSCRT